MTLEDMIKQNPQFRAISVLGDTYYSPKNFISRIFRGRDKSEDDINSIEVDQGQYAVKTYSKENPSLQTWYVNDCVAITIYDKKNKRGFMAHIDAVEKIYDFEKLLNTLGFNPADCEARIIGGRTGMSEGMAEHYGGHFESKFYDKDIFDSCCNVSRLEKPISYEDLKEDHIKNEFLISFKPELKNCIDFQQSDIFKDKDLISPDNTILLFRNVWKYLGENGIDKLSDFLAKYMKKSSLLVIGEWDIQNNIAEVLTRKGFKDTLYHRFSEKQIFEAPGAN